MVHFQTRRKRLKAVYEAYNRRDVAAMVAALDPQVEWTDMLEGAPIKGREAVGAYWSDQFKLIDIEVSPLTMEPLPDGRLVVTADQTIKKPDGTLWGNERVTHLITFGEDGLILRMDAS